MATIKDAPKATNGEMEVSNFLLEKMKKNITYFEMMIEKSKDFEIEFSHITEILKYINREKLSRDDMGHIVRFNQKYTFEGTSEESIANQLKFTFNSYISRLRLITSIVKTLLSQFNKIIQINNSYILETSAYNIGEPKNNRNMSLYDFLER